MLIYTVGLPGDCGVGSVGGVTIEAGWLKVESIHFGTVSVQTSWTSCGGEEEEIRGVS